MGFLAGTDLSTNRIEQARQHAAQRGYIDLTSSNPTQQGLLFPPEVLREASEGYWQRRCYQPDAHGDPAAREAIAHYYAQRHGNGTSQLTAQNTFITASTSEAYSLLFALLTEPGDNVLAPDVSYPLFDFLADLHHVALRPYHLNETRGWQVDEDSLMDAADEHTRAVLFISPHNPTGAILQTPLPVLDQLNLPIICDEVFAEFTYQVPRTPVFTELHPELPVFVLNGISKLFALPDLKLGWIALNGRAANEYAERLDILNDTFLGANSLTQFMLPTLFERGWGFVDQQRAYVHANVDLALAALAGHSRISAQAPDGGYNLFCAVEGWDDEEALVLHLLEHGVLVHPGYFFNHAAERAHIMISCLTRPDVLRRGLDILIQHA